MGTRSGTLSAAEMHRRTRRVVIAGRPNVGKSTLLNRIVGRREAIVEERPGVTRDRKAVEAEWKGHRFELVDTGGWLRSSGELEGKVSEQAARAIGDADAVLLVTDATSGLTDEDAAVGALLQRGSATVYVVVNKVDDPSRDPLIWDFLGLGLGDPWPVSALHGRGVADLLDRVCADLFGELEQPEEGTEELPAAGEPELESGDSGETFSVAIVGRPNVGKSTLFNRLIGEDRSIVHDVPGTTRDTVDTVVDTAAGRLRFVDTAGMRRRGKVSEATEYYSVLRSLRAVDRADVVLLVIDASVGVTHQDQRLAERIDAAGSPIIVLLNKWDLLDASQRQEVEKGVGERMRFLPSAAVLKVSALSGKGVHKLGPLLWQALGEYERRVPTARVNRVLRAAQQAHPAPSGARVLYATQGAANPPTFTLFVNKALPRSYLRYLERKLREDLALGSTPIKLRVRQRSG